MELLVAFLTPCALHCCALWNNHYDGSHSRLDWHKRVEFMQSEAGIVKGTVRPHGPCWYALAARHQLS